MQEAPKPNKTGLFDVECLEPEQPFSVGCQLPIFLSSPEHLTALGLHGITESRTKNLGVFSFKEYPGRLQVPFVCLDALFVFFPLLRRREILWLRRYRICRCDNDFPYLFFRKARGISAMWICIPQ